MSVDLSCLELIWLFFPSESPSFQIPIIEKLSFQLVRLEIWHLLLSHFIHPLSFNPICSTFKIFEISTILSIPSPLSHYILLEYYLVPLPYAFFFQFMLYTATKIMWLSCFLIMSFYSKTINGLSATYKIKLKYLRLPRRF